MATPAKANPRSNNRRRCLWCPREKPIALDAPGYVMFYAEDGTNLHKRRREFWLCARHGKEAIHVLRKVAAEGAGA